MVTVKSATYGDENNTTDVTKVMTGKLTSGKADFSVDDSIVPMLVTSETVELTDEERADAKDQATKECGNANDTQCIRATTNRISQALLEEKIENQKRAGNVTGARLTVTVVDKRGREKTIIVPKGQKFIYGQPVNPKVKEKSGFNGLAVLKYVFATFSTFFSVIFGVILVIAWAFSIGATWRAFIQQGYKKPAYVATAIAILVPLSGFIITPVFYAFLKYFA